jgi:hypothetical protein
MTNIAENGLKTQKNALNHEKGPKWVGLNYMFLRFLDVFWYSYDRKMHLKNNIFCNRFNQKSGVTPLPLFGENPGGNPNLCPPKVAVPPCPPSRSTYGSRGTCLFFFVFFLLSSLFQNQNWRCLNRTRSVRRRQNWNYDWPSWPKLNQLVPERNKIRILG